MHEVAGNIGVSVELQMSILLLVSLGGYLVAARLRQPAIVGQMIIGIALGPSWLGWVSYTEFIRDLASMGAVVLLFVIGLEFQIRDIARMKNLLIAASGVIIPWGSGVILALIFDFEMQRAMFIGLALSATSVAITADVLRELGKLNSSAAKIIIGAAVIDDVLALLALSITTQMASASLDWVGLLWLMSKAVLFLALGVLIGRVIINRGIRLLYISRLAKTFPETVFVSAMAVAFLYAVVAEMVGLSAIVGAFLAGVCLEEASPGVRHHFRLGAEHLRIVFGGIFFVSLGVLADMRAMTWELAVFLILLTVVAVISKLLGCGLPARWTGSSWQDAWIIGLGMVPRGEVAMVVALLALNAGMIEQPAYATLVLVAIVTSLGVPPILRLLYASADKRKDVKEV